MDINELKFLLKNSASVVVMEEGQPSLVIVDYHVYKNMVQAQQGLLSQPRTAGSGPVTHEQQFSPEEQEAVERLNREILALKEQIAMEEPGE